MRLPCQAYGLSADFRFVDRRMSNSGTGAEVCLLKIKGHPEGWPPFIRCSFTQTGTELLGTSRMNKDMLTASYVCVTNLGPAVAPCRRLGAGSYRPRLSARS